jgi:peptidyl-prolyl cis-trans isomerase SDCCAG10
MPDEEARLCAVHRVLDCESCNTTEKKEDEDGDDEGWREHALVFKKDTRANVYEAKIDDYSFIDPRAATGSGDLRVGVSKQRN